MLKTLSLILIFNYSLFAMHSFELNLNEKDLEGEIQLDIGQYNETLDPDTTFIALSYLAATAEHSSLNADPRGLTRMNFYIQNAVNGFEDLVIGMGVKFAYTAHKTSSKEHSFYALPFGLHVKYQLPFNLPVGFFLGAEGYYSPEVLSFGDAKNYLESNGFMEIQLIDRGSILGGYRNIETNYLYSGGDIRVNESWYAGFKFLF